MLRRRQNIRWFLTDIKLLSKNCNFCNSEECLNSLLRDRIVSGISSDIVREKLLAEKQLTFDQSIEISRSAEKAQLGLYQLKKESNSEVVGAVAGSKGFGKKNYRGKRDFNLTCKFCSKKHQFVRRACPAFGKRCNDCGEMNHFARSIMCKPGPSVVRQIHTPENYEQAQKHLGALFLGFVDSYSGVMGKEWEIKLLAKKGKVRFKIDTRAEVSVIGLNHLGQFGKSVKELAPTERKLIGPDRKPLTCFGFFSESLEVGDIRGATDIYVCQNVETALLGRPALSTFRLVEVKVPSKFKCTSINYCETKDDVVKMYPNLFQGLGLIKGDTVKIELQEKHTPYQLGAPRRVAFPLLTPLKEDLQRMVKMEVIREVDEPTEWCHPIVLVDKPDKTLRVCIDLTQLNRVTKREYYELPSVDETLAKLGQGCKYMSKLDANSGCWQLPLDKESQLTLFPP